MTHVLQKSDLYTIWQRWEEHHLCQRIGIRSSDYVGRKRSNWMRLQLNLFCLHTKTKTLWTMLIVWCWHLYDDRKLFFNKDGTTGRNQSEWNKYRSRKPLKPRTYCASSTTLNLNHLFHTAKYKMPDSTVYYCIRLELSNSDISPAISVQQGFCVNACFIRAIL